MNSYHQETIYQRGSLLGHSLDWSNRPLSIKAYRQRQPLPLPALAEVKLPGFFDASLSWPPRLAHGKAANLDGAVLGEILRLSAGITSPRWEDGQALGLRAMASAGGLYPSELYVAASGIAGVDDGLYHFSPLGVEGAWELLWPANLARIAAQALGGRAARLTFFITSVLWRSLWKYNSRAYRYCLLDAGHMLGNLELVLGALGHMPRSSINFVDNSVAVMLGLADQEEVPLAVVRAGGLPDDPGPEDLDLPPFDLQARPLSRRVGRDYSILQYHGQSKLEKAFADPLWQSPAIKSQAGLVELSPPQTGGPPLDAVISGRRSRRVFSGQPLTPEQLSNLLVSAIPADSPAMATLVLGPHHQRLKAGTYLYLPGQRRLMPRSTGQDLRAVVAEACLSQGFMARASLLIIFWADLHSLEENIGVRAYRQAMLAAGRMGQRCYLAAEAMGLNCCGIGAFYDDDLASISGMPARALPLYVLAVGN